MYHDRYNKYRSFGGEWLVDKNMSLLHTLFKQYTYFEFLKLKSIGLHFYCLNNVRIIEEEAINHVKRILLRNEC